MRNTNGCENERDGNVCLTTQQIIIIAEATVGWPTNVSVSIEIACKSLYTLYTLYIVLMCAYVKRACEWTLFVFVFLHLSDMIENWWLMAPLPPTLPTMDARRMDDGLRWHLTSTTHILHSAYRTDWAHFCFDILCTNYFGAVLRYGIGSCMHYIYWIK